jgi:hypothetical protein
MMEAECATLFRPTLAAAILGMIPIAPTIFWGPMAYAIMGGLAVATLLTLVFLPALYVTWFRIKNPHPSPYQNAVVGKTAMVIHSLKPIIELRQLAREAWSKSLDPDPLMAFSSIFRADLDNVHRIVV